MKMSRALATRGQVDIVLYDLASVLSLEWPLNSIAETVLKFYAAQFSEHLCPPFQVRPNSASGVASEMDPRKCATEQRTKSVEKPVVSGPSERQEPLLEKDPIPFKVGNLN